MRTLIRFGSIAAFFLTLEMTPQTTSASIICNGAFTGQNTLPAAANANFPLNEASTYLVADTDENIFALGAAVPSALSFSAVTTTTKRASSSVGFTSPATSSGLIVTAVPEPLTYALPLFGLVFSSVLMWKCLGRTNESQRTDVQ